MTCVLDSSALLANIWGEAGAELVTDHLEGAVISSVNFAEVVSKLVDRGIDEKSWRRLLKGFGLEVVAFDENAALDVGLLLSKTRNAGLSLGDRACISLAQRRGLPLLTADKVWATLQLNVEIKLVR